MLLLAAGLGRRFGGTTPKAYLDCEGSTLVERCLARLTTVTPEREIVVARPPDRCWDGGSFPAALERRLRAAGADRVIAGGSSRQDSMRRALAAAGESGLVLIHDAARPFFPVAACRLAIERAAEVGAALLAIPAPDTLKRVDRDGQILETVNRDGIWLAQTPQIVRRDLLERALEAADRDGFEGTDDVSLLERIGATVEVVQGSTWNIKITTPEDMRLGELITRVEATP